MQPRNWLLALLLLLATTASALPDIKLYVEKTFYNQNESIELYGILYNVSASAGIATSFTPLTSQNVTLTISNSTGYSRQYNFTTDNNGSFYSNSTYYPSATPVYAPTVSEYFSLAAQYNSSGTLFNSSVTISVGNRTVDVLILQPSKAEFAPSETMNVTATALSGSGTQMVRVSNVFINGSVRYYLNGTILRSFSCTTGSDGTCSASFAAPSPSNPETFILEANGFQGYSIFQVTSFSVSVLVKDADGKEPKDVFSPTENGVVEVRVSINNTVPTSGNYTGTVTIGYFNNTVLQTLSSVFLNSNNTFTNRTTFAASSLHDGTFVVNATVRNNANNQNRSQLAILQVKSWTLSVAKAAQNSGFEYGGVTLPNATLRFEALPVNRSNGTVITGLTSAFSYELKTPLGTTVSNGTTVVFNSSCGSAGCYEFSVRAPSAVGVYQLAVSATHNSITRSQTLSVIVDGFTATASTTDGTGRSKAVFGFTELANVNFTIKNATSIVNLTNAELASVTYSNGTTLSYTQRTNLSLINVSDNTLEWGWNSSSNRLLMEVPRIGGLYSVEAYVNNQSARATASFFANPYDTCFSAKASADENTQDYYWQFKPSDTIYVYLTVIQAENAAGANTSSVAAAMGHASYGRGSACTFDSSRKQAVSNATVTTTRVFNIETGLTEALNSTSSACQSLSTQGHYLCTLAPNDTVWDSGRYEVEFSIRSQDQTVSDTGSAFFETRSFYVWGYASNWLNRPTNNITINIQAYEAGSSWWTSSTGLAGTASLQRIEYRGNYMYGEWMSSGTTFDYNTSGLNASSISNGVGTMTLDVNRTPNGYWPAGSYTARIQLTAADGRVDYGMVWFDVRYWDAWAQQVDDSGSSIQYRWSNAPNQTVRLYVRITNAGDYNDFGGSSLGGSVTIRVKSIQSYTSSGMVELSQSDYSSPSITVNQTSPYPSSVTYRTHILNITPTTRLPSGSYNVVLELNGTVNGTAAKQQGWGWFSIKAFHAETQPVNATSGAYLYMTRGRGAVAFNVTTAQDERSSYTGAPTGTLINTTITGLRLNMWQESGQQTYVYPTDLNFTPSTVNGTQKINVSRASNANWSGGWYWGELTLQDSQGNQQNAYLWFGVKPFQITLTQASYTVGRTANFTGTIAITDSGSGASIATATSNYTITAVREVRWTSGGRQTRSAVIHGNASWNGSQRSFAFGPPSGRWQTSEWGWLSVEVTVRDESEGTTETYWASFSAKSFNPQLLRTSAQDISYTSNVTLNITLRQPDGTGSAAGNLTRISYYDYSTGQTKLASFVVNNSCTSTTAGAGGCLVNSTAYYSNGTTFVVTAPVVVSPDGGSWPEGYVYLSLEFTDYDNAALKTNADSSIYFYTRDAFTAYSYSVNATTRGYQSGFSQNESVGYTIYSVRDIDNSAIAVNITNVQHYGGNEWRESMRTYANVTWSSTSANNQISSGGTGYIAATPPSGGWPRGSNYLRVNLVRANNSSQTGVLKGLWFWVN